MPKVIIHAEGVFFGGALREQAISSTPQACGFGFPSSAPTARIVEMGKDSVLRF